MTQNDYVTVTELPGADATAEQMAMLFTRYTYAATCAEGKDVLEVGCGPGVGLGYLDRKAKRTVGGDFSEKLLLKAKKNYGERIPLLRFDAHKLPFLDESFDMIVFYETLYYLIEPSSFVKECQRVLRDMGILLICSANKEWSGFNPSPFSVVYFSISEITSMLNEYGFSVEAFGAFPVDENSLRSRAISVIRRVAINLNLIPKTMDGKKFLKRLFYGKCQQLPGELEDGGGEVHPLEPISGKTQVSSFKVIYVVSRLDN